MLNVDAPLPPALTLRIPAREEVLKHEVKFNAMRWRREIDELGLPELDPRLGRGERASLSRGDVLRLGDEVTSSDDAIQLLYASLAWGLGPKARNLRQRLTGLQSESTC